MRSRLVMFLVAATMISSVAQASYVRVHGDETELCRALRAELEAMGLPLGDQPDADVSIECSNSVSGVSIRFAGEPTKVRPAPTGSVDEQAIVLAEAVRTRWVEISERARPEGLATAEFPLQEAPAEAAVQATDPEPAVVASVREEAPDVAPAPAAEVATSPARGTKTNAFAPPRLVIGVSGGVEGWVDSSSAAIGLSGALTSLLGRYWQLSLSVGRTLSSLPVAEAGAVSMDVMLTRVSLGARFRFPVHRRLSLSAGPSAGALLVQSRGTVEDYDALSGSSSTWVFFPGLELGGRWRLTQQFNLLVDLGGGARVPPVSVQAPESVIELCAESTANGCDDLDGTIGPWIWRFGLSMEWTWDILR